MTIRAVVAISACVLCAVAAATRSSATGAMPPARSFTFAGVRHVHHETFANGVSKDAYDDDYVATAKRTDTLSSGTIVRIEERTFVPRTGTGRFDAIERERSRRELRRTGAERDTVVLTSEIVREPFGFLEPPCGALCGHSLLDGSDRRRAIETYDRPPLVWTAKAGTFVNDIARSIAITGSYAGQDASGDSHAMLRIEPDGAVERSVRLNVQTHSLEQRADGSGSARDSAPGFYDAHVDIGIAERKSTSAAFTIPVSRQATGRTIGPPPYPASTSTTDVPDWYSGGGSLRPETNVLTSSGPDDRIVPAICGESVAGKRAHEVVNERSWTRIDGTNERAADDTYSSGVNVLCTIERDRVETFDDLTGRRTAIDDTMTVLASTSR